ncbi:MAG: DUF402 domain-containing protein [Dehalococcoidia bacterium]|nr:DUF402 domain-containing protein [Dehalococcoidia bacterium]
MTGQPGFQPGQAIAFRDVFRGRVKAAVPLRVVEDSSQRFVGWLPSGARFFLPVDGRGVLVKDVFGFEQLGELAWTVPESAGQLVVCPLGGLYSVVMRFFGPGWQMPEWYINLQSPLTRTRIGFDSTDLILDLVVGKNGDWRWKDEEEFASAIARGFASESEARNIRDAGEAALRHAIAGHPPFDSQWLKWRPPSDWSVPELPAGWADHAASPGGPGFLPNLPS